MTDQNNVSGEPVWWVSDTSALDAPSDYDRIREHTVKCQTFFEARSRLGGHPVRVLHAILVLECERAHGRVST